MRTSAVSADVPELAVGGEAADSPRVELRAYVGGPFSFLHWRRLCRGLAQLPLALSPRAVSGAVVGTIAHGARCDSLCAARKKSSVQVSV